MSDDNINININVVTKKSVVEAGAKLKKVGEQGKVAGQNISKGMNTAKLSADKMRNAAATLAVGLAALAAIAGKSINAFKAFENGLINVQKVTNISGKNLAAFGREIDRMANRIPVGTSELLNLAQTAGQLGIQGVSDILAFTEAVALLTRTTDLTIDSAVKLAQLIAVSATGAEDIGRLSAVIVDLGNNFSATESQILEVSTRIAQSTTQFNILAEDALALGAVIAGVGEKAEASGTAIGKTFRSFETAIKSGGESLDVLTNLTGLQQEELASLFKSDPTALLIKFTEGLRAAGDRGELISVLLSKMGLKTDRLTRVLGPLIKNSDLVTEAFQRKEAQMIKQNAAIEEARKQFSSLASAEILTKNATIELSKTLGSALEPAYRAMLETIRTVAIATTRFVQDNVPLIKILVGAVAGLTVAFGVLSTVAAIAFLPISAPIAAGIALLAIYGAAIAAVIVYWEEFKLQIDIAVVAMLEFSASIYQRIGEIESAFKKFLGGLARDMFKLITGLNLGFGILAEAIDSVFGTEISENIEKFKKKMDDTIKSLEGGDSLFKKMASSTRDQAAALKETTDAQIEYNKEQEKTKKLNQERIEEIRRLEDEQDKLRKIIATGRDEDVIGAQTDLKIITGKIRALEGLSNTELSIHGQRKERIAELKLAQLELGRTIELNGGRQSEFTRKRSQQIQDEINKLTELNKKQLDGGKEKVDELLEIEKRYQGDLENLRREGDSKAIEGLKVQLDKKREEEIKAFRTSAIENNKFAEASRAQLLLNENENTRIKAEEEKKRQDKLKEIRDAVNDSRKEQESIERVIKVTDDQTDLEALRLKKQEEFIIELEARLELQELNNQHILALKTQRQIDREKEKIEEDKATKERSKALKKETDTIIRERQSRSRVERIIAQTTSQQLIGIGDNLLAAGIVQGKTAGKALQGLKIGEAIVSTASAVTKALDIGYPQGLVAAVSVGAAGAAQIAAIASQKFATGGIVQPKGIGSAGIDKIPALLSVGEEVLTANNPRHRDNIGNDSEGGNDRALLEAINGLRSDMQNMQTIVQIDGKEVADVIQTQRFRGVS